MDNLEAFLRRFLNSLSNLFGDLIPAPGVYPLDHLARGQGELPVRRVNNALVVELEQNFFKIGGLVSEPALVVGVHEHNAGAKRTKAHVDLMLLAGVIRFGGVAVLE